MSPKNKKTLLISGITIGSLAVVAGLPLIAYGIQAGVNKTKQDKTQKLVDEFKKQKESVVKENKATLDTIENKKEELFNLQDNYKDLSDKNSTEAKDLLKNINNIKNELKKLENDYQQKIDEATFDSLKNAAENGEAKFNDEIVSLTAKYVVLSYKAFLADLKEAEKNYDFNYPTKEDVSKITEFYQSWIDKFSLIKKDNLNVTSTAWVGGLKYDWEIAKSVYASHSRLIGTYLGWGLSYAYPANSFYETINEIKGSDALKVKRNLKEGIESGITLSKVVIKNNINSILTKWYTNELKAFLKGSANEKSVLEIIEDNKSINAETKEFHKFYVSEYYKAAKHGLGENIEELKVYKTNKFSELEDTIEVLDGSEVKSVYGLGLTQKDLDAKNVGISHIQANNEAPTNGNKLYESILKISTTSNDTAQEVYDSGYETAKTAANNMLLTAKAVANLIAGVNKRWAPKIKYDEDGVGSKEAKEIRAKISNHKGNINLVEFNKWLNQEKFFFGREDSSYYTDELKNSLDKDENLKNAREQLKNNNYEFLKTSDAKYGSITNKQFYYGALEAFKGYNQFRETTMDFGFSFFANQVPKYGISTYKYSRRNSEGVGAYNERVTVEEGTRGSFQFNVDPYYSLPKWSVTSFANHESVMGHHNQVYYAKQFLKKINNETIGNIFDYTSYIEGWALFMEWFGIEAGLYGTPNFENEDYYALPVDFKKANGITSFIKADKAENVTDKEIDEMKKLHGGVYWELVASENPIADDKEHTLKAAELTNMLQYFGALNEAQLRNMRRAIDPAYHGNVTDAKEGLSAGASISEVRAYMKANSALGIGDITSESKRYLNLPGQATSYNSGKELMLKLYDRVRKSKELSRKDFVGNKENIKEFLNLLLETGALPLDTLTEIVEKYYKL